MRRKVMPKEVISVVKLSLFPIWCWPLSQDATRLKMFCVKLYHCICIILEIGLGAPLIYAVTNHLDDPIILVQLIVLIFAIVQNICFFILYRVNCHRIQNVTVEMEHFFDFMKLHEEIIIQRYIDKCIPFYGTSLFIFFITCMAVTVIVPTVMHQPFPTFAEYPFDVYYQPLKTIIYIHQSVVGIIVTAQLCTNVFMALLLWFVSARFEILTEELRTVTTIHQLIKFIKKHQELFKYAGNVTTVVRPFAFLTICCTTICIISTFLLLVTNQPILIVFRTLTISLTGIAEVFMYTWPAEHLIHMSEVIAEVVFYTLENNHLTAIGKSLQIIIMRSQKAIKIAIPCLMPALSLHYFTSYLSTIFSYFTTLRIIMDDDKD